MANQSYIGFARRYRPQVFTELVGQEQIAHSLSQQVLQDRVAQAYIFSGPRGVGKTSAARILAKSVNCLEGPTPQPCGVCNQCVSITSGNSMDVIEIDGASNNGVDNIRDLQETISQNPFSARKKIYIIDEVHMLSAGAFNALLKTLEEPPPFVIFIFATTEFEKIPETIKSRCQAFQFRRISLEDLIRRLDYVVDKENLQMDPGERRTILETIALAVDGGLRDAMMALDQLAALSEGHVQLDETVRFLGVVEHDLLIRTVEMLHYRDTRGLLEMVNMLVERGRDLERFVKNFLGFLRDLMVIKSGGGKDLVNLTGDKLERAEALLWATDESGYRQDVLTFPALLNYLQVFMELEAQLKEAVQVRIHLEFAFVKVTAIEPVVDIAHLLEDLDRRGAGGAARASGGNAPAAPMARPAAVASAPSASPPISKPASSPPEPTTPDIFGGAPKSNAAATGVMHTAEGLWNLIVQNKERLGIKVKTALDQCQCLSYANDCLNLGVSNKALAKPILQSKETLTLIEGLLLQLTGSKIRVTMTLITSGSDSGTGGGDKARTPAPAKATVTDSNDFFQEPEDEENGASFADNALNAHDLYLQQNPEARIRAALKNNEGLREKVDMIRRFFDGRLFDLAGKEVVL